MWRSWAKQGERREGKRGEKEGRERSEAKRGK
jgi:hypothetical protein